MEEDWLEGWEQLLRWNKEKEQFEYRGYKVIPLPKEDERPVPLQNKFYWDQIDDIDFQAEVEEKKEVYDNTISKLEESHNLFCGMVND